MKEIALAIACIILPFSTFAELPLGTPPPMVRLEGKAGGRVDGTPWSSNEIKGKVFALFYVDPDQKDLNEHASQALKRAKFPDTLFASIAVINMAATWLPNVVIGTMLKKKQKVYPRTIYVKDKEKRLVKQWNLADHTSDIVVFDRQGRVIFSKDGRLSNAEVSQLLSVVRACLEPYDSTSTKSEQRQTSQTQNKEEANAKTVN